MNQVMTDKEANDLFNEVSKAIKESDTTKLSDLTDKQPDPDQEPVVEVPDETDPVPKDNEDDTHPLEEAETTDEDKKGETVVESPELQALKAQLDKATKENHALRSQAGRVPHVQRRVKELDEKLEALQKQLASPSSQASTKITPKVEKLLEGLKGTDPELADTIAAAIAAATEGLAEDNARHTQETLTLLRDQQAAQHNEAELDRLLEMYPNAPDVFASPQWSDWKKGQTTAIRTLAGSDSADDVAFVFEKYAADMIAKYPELAKAKDGSTGEAAPAPTDAEKKAQQVEAERQRRKESSVNIGNPEAAGKVSLPDDPNALFVKYSDEIRKQRTGK